MSSSSGEEFTVVRVRRLEDGSVVEERVLLCVCTEPRGPSGGMCERCGLAVPTLHEANQYWELRAHPPGAGE